mgnify:CR=1 FL=1
MQKKFNIYMTCNAIVHHETMISNKVITIGENKINLSSNDQNHPISQIIFKLPVLFYANQEVGFSQSRI